MYPVHVEANQEIITQGSLDASKFYVIESGQVEVSVPRVTSQCPAWPLCADPPIPVEGPWPGRDGFASFSRRFQPGALPPLHVCRAACIGHAPNPFSCPSSGSHLQVRIVGEDGATKTTATLQGGATFGEIALLYNTARTATVSSQTKCKMWVLERHVYKYICRRVGSAFCPGFAAQFVGASMAGWLRAPPGTLCMLDAAPSRPSRRLV